MRDDDLAEELDRLRAASEAAEIGFGRSPAVLMIGCQRIATNPPPPKGEVEASIRPIRRLLAAARRVAVPVLFALRAPPRVLDDPGSEPEAAPIDPRYAPEPGDPRVATLGISAFEGGSLEGLVMELGVDTLILAGGCEDDRLRQTAAEAARRGLNVLVARECVAGPAAQVRATLLEIQRLHGDVIEIGEALAYFERAHIESMLAALE